MLSQLIIIAMLDMSDPYWPLIIASYRSFDPKTLQYWSGALYMAPLLTTIFTTLIWTKMGERFGYKKMILRAGAALAISQWMLIFLKNPGWILLVRLSQGAMAGFTAAAQAWALKITSPKMHSQIVGRLQSATALGSILGPICGGFLANYYGYFSIFMMAGLVCALVSVFLAQFLTENPFLFENKKIELKSKKNTSKQSLLLLLICFTQAARWMSTPFFSLYIVEQLHSNTITVGIIYALMALMMSITAPALGQVLDKKTNYFLLGKEILVVVLFVSGFVYWCYAFISKVYLALILSLFLGISFGAIPLILFTFLLKGIKEDSRSQIVGISNTSLKLGNLLGILIGTIVQAEGRFMTSFIFIGIFYFSLAFVSLHYKQIDY
ncbi:MFS transporter [Rickettsiella grylli]|uniref:Drug:H+ antiporter-1 n=2 Tax=Rickettsiella grylli TaxID=59196 RepID=A8PKD6_9COXI|nr:MFS transporter [Rickettsiella grylli]EDP46741.1 putative drug:H+ antiporter-1 [Rickettsiella grylli]